MGKKANQNNKQNQSTQAPLTFNNKKLKNHTRSAETFDNALMFRKKQWTQKQDKTLIKTIKQYGAKKWSFIAEFIPGRIGKQCRERWHNHLNPNINKQEWSQLQQWVLFLMHTAFGGKWARMTKTLTKRTDNSIKNHWNSIMQKKIQYFKQNLQETLSKPKELFSEEEYQDDNQNLSSQIKNLLQIIKNGQTVPISSMSLPISRNNSQINQESLASSFHLKSRSIDQGQKSQNSLNIRTTNLLQAFRNPCEQLQIEEKNEALLQKNISFFNSQIQSSDIGLQELLQKYDHMPSLAKKISYNYFPSSKLSNSELMRQNSYQFSSKRKDNSMIDENYQSPTNKKHRYSNVFDEENEQNILLPQPRELDSPLVPLLIRKSSRNRSFMSPTRFLQKKASSSQNI